MIELINLIVSSFLNNYYDKQWGRLILKSIGIVIVAICMSFLLGNLAILILDNIEGIVITIGAIFCFFTILFSFLPKKQVEVEAKPKASIMEYDPITLEATYKIIRKNLCSVLGDISEITKLRKPTTLSQLDCPTHFDIISKAVVYHFLALKQSDEIDTFNVIGILQNTIEQRLNNNEVEGITQTIFFYNGQAYPSIMIDKVQDLGNYVQIDVAIASEFYCKYRERRIYNNMNQSATIKPHDKDF